MRGMASRIDNIYGTGAVKTAGGLVIQDHMNQEGQIIKGKQFSDDQKFELLQYMNSTKKNMIKEVKGTWGQVANQFSVTLAHLRDQFMLSGGVLDALAKKLTGIAKRFSSGDLSDKFTAFGESVSKFIDGFNIDTFFLVLKQAFNDLKDFGIELKNIRMIVGGLGAGVGAVTDAVANPYQTANEGIKESSIGNSFLEGYSSIRHSISDLFKDHSMKRPEQQMKITVDDKRTMVEMLVGQQVTNKAQANLGMSQ
jgi:phage tail tape-measure protein